MGCPESSDASASRNIRFFRATNVTVRPSRTEGTLALEVVDQHGDGFAAELTPELALDLVLLVVGAVARLQGWAES